jgi:hypothetical protein
LNASDCIAYPVTTDWTVIFLGKVDVICEQCFDIEDNTPKFLDLARQATIKLMEHDSPHCIGRCVNQISDCLCLNKIELSVENCAACELTWVRLACTRMEKCRDECFGNDQPAVGRELDCVITCVGTR